MFEKFLLFAALLTVVWGNAVGPTTRQGRFNKYYLYTRQYENARRETLMPGLNEFEADPTLDFPLLINTNQTIVIVHGHGGDWQTTLNPVLKDAFFDDDARPDAQLNVIVVDWSEYTMGSYNEASAAVQGVGNYLGDYLKILSDQDRISLDNLHLIGFNLGAHIVGFAGRRLDGNAARITGLDPSGSLWSSNNQRLSKSDAQYVEVIHTDGDGIFANGIGTAIGDVDFFVNGIGNQPGCLSHACNHRRAYEVMAATLIRNEPLYGFVCNNLLQLSLNTCRTLPRLPLGGDQLTKQHGQSNLYRVNTGRNYPF